LNGRKRIARDSTRLRRTWRGVIVLAKGRPLLDGRHCGIDAGADHSNNKKNPRQGAFISTTHTTPSIEE
jgi:hypothetical protein